MEVSSQAWKAAVIMLSILLSSLVVGDSLYYSCSGVVKEISGFRDITKGCAVECIWHSTAVVQGKTYTIRPVYEGEPYQSEGSQQGDSCTLYPEISILSYFKPQYTGPIGIGNPVPQAPIQSDFVFSYEGLGAYSFFVPEYSDELALGSIHFDFKWMDSYPYSSPTYFFAPFVSFLKDDEDNDGDGVINFNDAFPLDPNESLNTDDDLLGNNEDPDDDNDGLTDEEEYFLGTDALLADTDNDGVNDLNDAFPLDMYESLDSDGDGIGDNADAFPNDSTESLDSDGDGVGNNADVYPYNSQAANLETYDGAGSLQICILLLLGMLGLRRRW